MTLSYILLSLLLLSLALVVWLWGRCASLQARLAAQNQSHESEKILQNTAFQAQMQQQAALLRKSNDEAMQHVVDPLQQEIERLRLLVDTQRQEQTRHTAALRTSLAQMMAHDQARERTTQELANALRNRGKVQGDWGEIVLENLLRESGLREGHEYRLQYSVSKADGHKDRPDVLLHAPDGGYIIIDSKVSLSAYVDYCGADNDAGRQAAQRANYQSLQQHIQELSNKQYPSAIDGAAPVVLMFVPNEGSYVLAMNHDPQFSVKALSKGIHVVSPANLMVVLRLMLLSWQHSRQEENNQHILRAATRIYEKYANFCTEYQKMGHQLGVLRNTYERCLGQMTQGPANLGKQLNDLLQWGIQPTKHIPQ